MTKLVLYALSLIMLNMSDATYTPRYESVFRENVQNTVVRSRSCTIIRAPVITGYTAVSTIKQIKPYENVQLPRARSVKAIRVPIEVVGRKQSTSSEQTDTTLCDTKELDECDAKSDSTLLIDEVFAKRTEHTLTLERSASMSPSRPSSPSRKMRTSSDQSDANLGQLCGSSSGSAHEATPKENELVEELRKVIKQFNVIRSSMGEVSISSSHEESLEQEQIPCDKDLSLYGSSSGLAHEMSQKENELVEGLQGVIKEFDTVRSSLVSDELSCLIATGHCYIHNLRNGYSPKKLLIAANELFEQLNQELVNIKKQIAITPNKKSL